MLSSSILSAPASLAAAYGPTQFEFSDALFHEVKLAALATLEKNSGIHFLPLLKHFPQLLNHPLNAEGQTPLILATLYHADEIIKELLKKNVNIYYRDKHNKSALDYVAEDSPLPSLLREKYFFLVKLQRTLHWEVNKNTRSSLQKSLLNLCAKALTFYDATMEKALDLYCTVNSVYQIILQHSAENSLKENIKLFFALRENFLRGDQHDYCYGFSYANQFCCQLAETLFPTDYAPNVLLANALTQDRDEPWQNPVNLLQRTALHHLPPAPGDYFRTQDNHIQLYLPIIKEAVRRIKKGETSLTEIWLSFDFKSEASAAALSAAELNLLCHRSPTLKILVNYTERLQAKTLAVGTTFVVRFQELFAALEQGDVFNSGMDEEAGASAYVSLHRFALWWNSLTLQIQEKIKSIRLPSMRSLGEIIDTLMDPVFEVTGIYRSSSRFCSNINSGNGKTYLANPEVRAQLLSIEKVTDWSLPELTLDEWVNTIRWELQYGEFQLPLKNIFAAIYKYPFFLSILQKKPQLLTYHNLNRLKSAIAEPGQDTPDWLTAAIIAHDAEMADTLLEFGGVTLITPDHIFKVLVNDRVAILKIMLKHDPSLLQKHEAALLKLAHESTRLDCIDVYFQFATISRQSWLNLKTFMLKHKYFSPTITKHALKLNDNDFIRQCATEMSPAKFKDWILLTTETSDTKTFLALFFYPLPPTLRQKNVITEVIRYMNNRILLQNRGQEYHSFWTSSREKFSASVKLHAARKAICYLLKTTVTFQQEEVDALHDGRLGTILSKFKVVLPVYSGQYNMEELKKHPPASKSLLSWNR